jgi:hypothetical protein
MQKPIDKQKGAALIIFAIILVLAAMAFIIKMLDPVALQAARDDKNAQFLAQAKRALISHSISRAVAGERPSDMPRPDYFPANEIPLLNYDGNSETGCVEVDALNLPIMPLNLITTGNVRCLGRLPWRTIGLTIPNPSENDITGSMPWYAVSANLVDPICLEVLNPNTLNLVNTPPPAPLDCSGLTLPYPWLTLRDSSGNILSSQVAAVLMLPNGNLFGQTRPTTPLGGVTSYLDSVTVPVGCAAPCVPGIYNNADFDNDFIIPPPFTAGSTANDRLVYITIQELMTAVERRATQEAAVQLRQYYTNSNVTATNRFYPYAANLGDVNNACVNTNLAGLIPIAAFADCTSASTCRTNFPITRVDFTLTSGSSFTSNTGSCSRIAGDCRCTGTGFCRLGTIRFTCTDIGNVFNCQSTGAGSDGTFSFTYTPKTPDMTVVSGACAGGAGTVNCVGGSGAFASPPTSCTHANPSISTLPNWFTDNNWQDFIYYAISNNCSAASTGCGLADLTVGTRNNVHAVVISSGVALPSTEAQPAPPQARPSAIVTDYLDSLVNTDGGTPPDPTNIIFDATSKMRANDYNDQPLIVAP